MEFTLPATDKKGVYSLKPSSWSSHGSQSSNSGEMILCSLQETVSKVEWNDLKENYWTDNTVTFNK